MAGLFQGLSLEQVTRKIYYFLLVYVFAIASVSWVIFFFPFMNDEKPVSKTGGFQVLNSDGHFYRGNAKFSLKYLNYHSFIILFSN